MENVCKKNRKGGNTDVRVPFGRKKMAVMNKIIKPPHYRYISLYDNRPKYKSNTMFLRKDEYPELFSIKIIMDSMETEINKVRKLKTLFIVPFIFLYFSFKLLVL